MTTDLDDEIRREFVAGPIRQADTVWEIGLRLTLLSDTHIGAAAPTAPHSAMSDVDRLVDRDPKTGKPRLRATTLAGLLRHHLADRLGREDNGEDPDGVNALFGRIERRETPGRAEDRPVMSVLDVDDAHGELPPNAGADGTDTDRTANADTAGEPNAGADGEPVADADRNPPKELPAVRTGNRVDPASGAVEAGKLWQMEVLPAGTRFDVTLRLNLRHGDHDEATLLALLTRATEGLTEDGPGIRLGARAGRGLGAVRAEAWSARRHDLRTPEGWAGYYARRWRQRWEDTKHALAPHHGGLQDAIATELDEERRRAAYDAALAECATDARRRAELHLTLAVGERSSAAFLDEGTDGADTGGDGNGNVPPGDVPPGNVRPGVILLGDLPRGAARATDADRAHRTRPTVDADGKVKDQPMLGDTALFALFKRIARRLVRDLGGEPDGPWCHRWWGSEPEKNTPDRAPVTSRITLRRAPHIDDGTALPTTRTTIDALFGDTVDGRLFTDQAWAGGTSRFVLDVRDADEEVCALLALIVRELHTVPFDAIGGGAGVGHGRVTATEARLVRTGSGALDGVDLLAVLRDPRHERRAEVDGWLTKLTTLTERKRPDRNTDTDTDTTEAVA